MIIEEALSIAPDLVAESDLQHAATQAIEHYRREREQHAATTRQLKEALAREAAILREKEHLLQRQSMLAQEFEHRLINSLQMIVSLLSLQGRKTDNPEVAAQLTIAATRIGALSRVHRRLHLLDYQQTVEIKQYIEHLCDDLSGLLFSDGAEHSLVVEGATIEIPTALGIPLGFIINELITNSAKYAKGSIVVRLETMPDGRHCLSVSDDGPGLPENFDPAAGKGLGMKLVASLVKEIGGELKIGRGAQGRGTCFSVLFSSSVNS